MRHECHRHEARADRVRGSAARRRILLTAHDLFYRDGVRATGIDRVIAESGVTKAHLLPAFPEQERPGARLPRAIATCAGWPGSTRRCSAMAARRRRSCRRWRNGSRRTGLSRLRLHQQPRRTGRIPAEVADITRRHKADMAKAIARLLSSCSALPYGRRQRRLLATDLATAVDGAIIRAQYDGDPQPALASLKRICQALLAKA
jgi:AcrR family transcriptional regulator